MNKSILTPTEEAVWARIDGMVAAGVCPGDRGMQSVCDARPDLCRRRSASCLRVLWGEAWAQDYAHLLLALGLPADTLTATK